MRRVAVAVIGGGIVGLAHAWAAARQGRSVALFERDSRAQGASVRNFGMVWPIGQPSGELLEMALRSRERWLELGREAEIWVNPCGSLHLAYEEDEWAVLQEFAERSASRGYRCALLTAKQTKQQSEAVQSEGLRGALWSETECGVDPRQAIARLPHYLSQKWGVQLHFGEAVTVVDAPKLRTAGGEVWEAEEILVCSGSDFETLFPRVFRDSGIRRCKLQMMRTVPQPHGWRLGAHLAGGLTLCHYTAFRECPSLGRVRERIERTMPDYVRLGIHVMASQNHLGEVILGDSHEYDEDIEIFDRAEIEERILGYLRRMVRLPDETLQARWHGIYAKHATLPMYTATPQPGVTIRVAPGGAGMTMSFGLADAFFEGAGR